MISYECVDQYVTDYDCLRTHKYIQPMQITFKHCSPSAWTPIDIVIFLSVKHFYDTLKEFKNDWRNRQFLSDYETKHPDDLKPFLFFMNEKANRFGCSTNRKNIDYFDEKNPKEYGLCHYSRCTFSAGLVRGQPSFTKGEKAGSKCNKINPEFPGLCSIDEEIKDDRFYNYNAGEFPGVTDWMMKTSQISTH